MIAARKRCSRLGLVIPKTVAMITSSVIACITGSAGVETPYGQRANACSVLWRIVIS